MVSLATACRGAFSSPWLLTLTDTPHSSLCFLLHPSQGSGLPISKFLVWTSGIPPGERAEQVENPTAQLIRSHIHGQCTITVHNSKQPPAKSF